MVFLQNNNYFFQLNIGYQMWRICTEKNNKPTSINGYRHIGNQIPIYIEKILNMSSTIKFFT